MVVLEHATEPLRTYGTIRREYTPVVAPAVNRMQKSSRGVGYLRGTVEVSNFCKALLFHDFRIRVARESLRRGFLSGSLPLWHLLAIRRIPLQNRGLRAESQIALRPRARQNGRLLHRISHRFFEVVIC